MVQKNTQPLKTSEYSASLGADPVTAAKAKKEKKRKLRHSIFLLTWNSNTKIHDSKDPKLQQLENHVNDWWNRFNENPEQYILIRNEEDKPLKSELLEVIDTQANTEIGPTSKMFHMHAIIKVSHRSKVALDIDKIINDMRDDKIAAACYVNVKGTSDGTLTLEKYIEKYNEKK